MIESDNSDSDLSHRKDVGDSKDYKEVVGGKQKQNKADDSTLDEECCSICFEAFTNYGDHRLSCLSCGHLFGFNCIERWLQQGGNDKCPQCNSKARTKDIRLLYARNIKVIDTVERDRALELAETEKELRLKTQTKWMECKVLLDMTQAECQLLRNQVKMYKRHVEMYNQTRGSSTPMPLADNQMQFSYQLDQSMEISKEGTARLMAYSPNFSLLVVSQTNTSPLVSKFGVKKVNTLDFRVGEYVGLHSKVIRDMAFSKDTSEPLLLSVSLDKGVHITSMRSNAIIQKYVCDVAAWSCAWNSENNNYFYAGLSNGMISLFDIRNITGPVEQIAYCQRQSKSPIVSVQHVPYEPTSDFSHGGLLVGQLDRSYFLRFGPDKSRDHHTLSLEGNLVDLNFEPSTRHFLASFRPSTKYRFTRFQLCTLTTQRQEKSDQVTPDVAPNQGPIPFPTQNQINPGFGTQQPSGPHATNDPNDNRFDCHVAQIFKGGMAQSLLTKSHIFMNQEASNFSSVLQICAGDEESGQLLVWDASSGALQYRLHTLTPILDILSITDQKPHLLLTLSPGHVQVFKWTPG